MSYEKTWPSGKWRRARKTHRCDYAPKCNKQIRKGDYYFDPMELNPDRAGGFGGYRFCKDHENKP